MVIDKSIPNSKLISISDLNLDDRRIFLLVSFSKKRSRRRRREFQPEQQWPLVEWYVRTIGREKEINYQMIIYIMK